MGQNFLIDRNVLEQIVNLIEIKNKEVLEIGPGSGNLTTFILKKNPKKFYAIEKDNDLALLLKDKFYDSIEIINDDILKISEDKISNQNSLFETVIVATNDELVDLFLQKKITYLQLQKYLTKFLCSNLFSKFKLKKPKNIEDIMDLNRYVRLKVRGLCI